MIMERQRFTISVDANMNYLASICRIGEIKPIEGADRIVATTVNGFTMVVSKDMHEGDIVVYFPVESAISEKYLSANNLYEVSLYMKNSNAVEVENILTQCEALPDDDTEGKKELLAEAKSKCGFFNKTGRVRLLKLKGMYSEGFIAGTETLERFDNTLEGIDWSTLVGVTFNKVNGEEICKKYIPAKKTVEPCVANGQRRWRKTMKRISHFENMIPDEFQFHYDTVRIESEMASFTPDDIVTITVKLDGTSAIFSNVKFRHVFTFWEKIKKFFGVKIPEIEYKNIYSSRRVIKNRDINPDGGKFYETDVWDIADKVFVPFIPKGMTVYGEIVGYEDGTSKFLQKNHDYGCKEGEWKFMPYRITTTNDDGTKKEWNVLDVDGWTHTLVENHPEIADRVQFLTVLYHGRLGDLYPDLDKQQHWHENLLERMKNDRKNFGMEEDEPLCRLKVPREGIVIRKDNDKMARAWKLKTMRHLAKEGKANDSGEANIEDIS